MVTSDVRGLKALRSGGKLTRMAPSGGRPRCKECRFHIRGDHHREGDHHNHRSTDHRGKRK